MNSGAGRHLHEEKSSRSFTWRFDERHSVSSFSSLFREIFLLVLRSSNEKKYKWHHRKGILVSIDQVETRSPDVYLNGLPTHSVQIHTIELSSDFRSSSA